MNQVRVRIFNLKGDGKLSDIIFTRESPVHSKSVSVTYIRHIPIGDIKENLRNEGEQLDNWVKANLHVFNEALIS
jgi:hypothetical protein